MKIAFTVTGPDLARALATMARDATNRQQPDVRPDAATAVSPEARNPINRTTETNNVPKS